MGCRDRAERRGGEFLMSEYMIQGSTMTGIANAVREMRCEKGTMTPAQIEAKIRESKLGIPIDVSCHTDPVTGKWVRPQGWPDLDAINIPNDFDGVYLTYDLTKAPGYAWIGIRCRLTPSNTGRFVVERGHLEGNAFVADYTSSEMAQTTYYRESLDSTYGNIQLWRVRSTSGSISQFGFLPNTSTSTDNFWNCYQPCVERKGRLSYMTSLRCDGGTNDGNRIPGSYGVYCTSFMERDCVMDAGKNANLTDFYGAWYNCYSLQELDMSTWDLSNCVVTTLSYAWGRCFNLKKIDDIFTWDTSKWKITGFSAPWQYCYSLEKLDLSGWDVSGWSVTSLSAMWSNCYSLKSLDVSTWDTSGWAITSLENTWNSCYSLVSLDLSGWDTSNWAVTNMRYTWGYCYSLNELHVSTWDTSNWAVTRMDDTWSQCYKLNSFEASTWDTSNWAVINLEYTWYNCYSLETLDLSGWDVSGWAVTTLGATWAGCVSMREFDTTGWDTSNWAVTTLGNTWNACYSLQGIDLKHWDVSNWPVTNLYGTWQSCHGMRLLDISTWDTSNWAVTDIRYMLSPMYSAEIVRVPSNFNLTASANANTQSPPSYSYMMTEYPGFEIGSNHTYESCRALTPASLVSIIDRLPTVTTTKTLTLGQHNRLKLTAAQIAVATGKGWTVA